MAEYIFIEEEPQVSSGPRLNHQQVTLARRVRDAGGWVAVIRFDKKSAANVAASRIRRGNAASWAYVGTFDTKVGQRPGESEWTVYALYTGEASN